MSQRLFTPEEVNRLIPRLTALLDTAMERYRQAVALQERLREERTRRAEASGEGVAAQIDRSTGQALEALHATAHPVVGKQRFDAIGELVLAVPRHREGPYRSLSTPLARWGTG